MMKLKVKGKLLILFVTSLIIFGGIVNYVINKQFNNYVTENTLQTDSNLSMKLIDAKYEGNWSLKDGKLYKGNVLINDNNDLVDGIKNAADVECTIFLNDTRIATTIMKDGVRVTGTQAESVVLDEVLKNKKEYSGSAHILNKDFKTVYLPIENASGTVIGMFFIGITEDTILSQVSGITSYIVLVTIIAVIGMAFMIFIFTKFMIDNPIKETVKNLDKLAEGDLTFEVNKKYLKSKDEFGNIARAVNQTQSSFRNMIGSMKEKSSEIDKSAETLSYISEEMASASESVSKSISEIACGTTNQSEHLYSISNITSLFGNHLENILITVDDIFKNANHISEMANENSTNMESLTKSIRDIDYVCKNNTENMEILRNKIDKINEISNVINGIASQTNLLSLNAAIEAARAGEAGKGFAVVADEIRKLADEAQISSENINHLINDILENSDMMNQSSSEMNNELSKEMEIVHIAVNSFDNINNAINVIVPKIQQIQNSSQTILDDKNTIIDKIENTSTVSKDMADSSQEISSSSEEMCVSIEEIANTAHRLSGMTNEMMENVNMFKL